MVTPALRHAGAAMRAGADCNAAASFTGRTPLHELAAAAAAAEMLGPSRGAAAGFILNMLLHAGVEVGDLKADPHVVPSRDSIEVFRAGIMQTVQDLPAATAFLFKICTSNAVNQTPARLMSRTNVSVCNKQLGH